MSRSIVSQIFSGLAYAAGGFLALGVLLSFLPSPHSLPKEMMPPSEGFILKEVWLAIFMYAGDHKFKYPENLKDIANSDIFSEKHPKRREFLSSPNLKYFPPPEPIRSPYAPEYKDTILLTYQTDDWFFSISVGSELKYHRKKKIKNPNEAVHVTPTSRHFACGAGGVPAVRGT